MSTTYPWQLAAVRNTSTQQTTIVDIFKGDQHLVLNSELAPAFDRNQNKHAYARFLASVANPDEDAFYWEDYLPVNGTAFSMNWALSTTDHKSLALPTPETRDDQGRLMEWKTTKLDEARFNDNLREAGAEQWYEYGERSEYGEEDHPFSPGTGGGYGIMLALGGAAAVLAVYAM